jgi:hypothetical protein
MKMTTERLLLADPAIGRINIIATSRCIDLLAHCVIEISFSFITILLSTRRYNNSIFSNYCVKGA